jgi:hypothetical protein
MSLVVRAAAVTTASLAAAAAPELLADLVEGVAHGVQRLAERALVLVCAGPGPARCEVVRHGISSYIAICSRCVKDISLVFCSQASPRSEPDHEKVAESGNRIGEDVVIHSRRGRSASAGLGGAVAAETTSSAFAGGPGPQVCGGAARLGA